MKAVIFDMDGVLFDTEKLCRDSWMVIAEEENLPDMENVFLSCVGCNLTDSDAIMKKAYGTDFDLTGFKKKSSLWMTEYIEKNGLPVKTGVREILSWLKGHGWRVGLASSTRKSSVERHLERAGLTEYFENLTTGDMVEHSKPQPDIYLLACKAMGLNPKEVYAIEDSPNGIRSAAAAGMKPIMVPDLIAPTTEMENLSITIQTNLLEVLDYLSLQQEI